MQIFRKIVRKTKTLIAHFRPKPIISQELLFFMWTPVTIRIKLPNTTWPLQQSLKGIVNRFDCKEKTWSHNCGIKFFHLTLLQPKITKKTIIRLETYQQFPVSPIEENMKINTRGEEGRLTSEEGRLTSENVFRRLLCKVFSFSKIAALTVKNCKYEDLTLAVSFLFFWPLVNNFSTVWA